MDSSSRVNISLEFNSDDMQALQNSFCRAHDMYMMCITKNHGPITSFSGSKAEEDFVDQFFTSQLRKELMDSFVDGDTENVVARYSEVDYAMLRGVAIRKEDGQLLGVWLCFAVNEKKIPEDIFISSEIKRTTEPKFEKALSLLEILTRYYFVEKVKNANLLQGLIEEKDSSKLMENRLVKNEIMTEILRMMESEDSFAEIAAEILESAGKYLSATHVSVLKLSSDELTADMIVEYVRGDASPMQGRHHDIDITKLPFYNDKPYTVSSDSILPDNFVKYFKSNGINAGIFLPIEINERTGMYLCIYATDGPRRWSVEDVRFANDIKRIIHTVLLKRITKNSLVSSYAALEAILQNTGCGVAVSDVAHREILYINETFKVMFADEIDRLAVDEILYDADELKDITGYAANGSQRWYNVAFSWIKWVDGRDVRLATFYDVSELKAYQKKMEKQANEDMLTGLYNRQKCEKDIEDEFHFATKTGKEFAVLMIDLDDFNTINEGLGHANGDSLLKFIAHAIDGISLITDKCYRVGGDEFAIIVDHEIIDKLDFIVKRICNLFDNPWVIGDKEFYCTMSMGAVRAPKDCEDSAIILKRLNIALHDAKNKGKNRFQFYDAKIENAAKERIELEHAMRQAVEDNCRQFEVFYQPIVEVKGDEITCCGAEALARWNTLTMGVVGPEGFIDLAEYLGLIVTIGEHVLYEACRRCKHWNDFGHPEYKVNVNLSVIQLVHPDIVDIVDTVLKKTAIDPHNLTLEVTESLAIEDMGKMNTVLKSLKALGCRVALDDFGTGYSSLNHIHDMPIDTIKIDKTFIDDIGKDKFSDAFVKTVSDLAMALGMDVCVEGIESEEQLECIRKYAVNVIQGFYFDRPLSAAEFEKKYLN